MRLFDLDLITNLVGASCIWHFLMFAYIIASGMRETKTLDLMNVLQNADKIYVAFAYLISGIGITQRKPWSRYFVIFLSFWSFINNLPLLLVLKQTVTTVAIVCYGIIYLSIIYYLTRPKVKRAFSERNPEPPQ